MLKEKGEEKDWIRIEDIIESDIKYMGVSNEEKEDLVKYISAGLSRLSPNNWRRWRKES